MPILHISYWDDPQHEVEKAFINVDVALSHCEKLDIEAVEYAHLLDDEGEVLWDHVSGVINQ